LIILVIGNESLQLRVSRLSNKLNSVNLSFFISFLFYCGTKSISLHVKAWQTTKSEVQKMMEKADSTFTQLCPLDWLNFTMNFALFPYFVFFTKSIIL